MTEWDAALAALEERLRQQEAVVEGRSSHPPTDALPMPVGPMPGDLALRALALLDRSRALEQRAGRELARRRTRLQ